MADDARRAVAAGKAMENTDIKKLVEHIGQSCIDNYGSLDKALRDVRYDSNGNVSRADMKIWFESHRVAIRMANKFFDHFASQEQKANNSDAISTVSMGTIKNVFDTVVGQHLARGESTDHKKHHHHHNVHGLLRPQHSEGSIISVPNADSHHVAMTQEKLKKIAKQMTSKSQRRYIDKYGNIGRQELQHMFESYGLTPEQSNELFNSVDTERQGEIKFKDLSAHLAEFLHVDAPKKASDTKHVQRDASGRVIQVARDTALDDETMTKICDHVGGKAAAKFKSVFGAFRFVDPDLDGKVDRFEVRNFFRNYGSKTGMADRFFDTLDHSREGRIDFAEFQKKFAPYIQKGYHAPRAGENQADIYKQQKHQLATYQTPQEAPTAGGQHKSNFCIAAGAHAGRPPSSRSSNRSSRAEDELHANRFGRFEGVSTYQASYNADVYRQVDRAAG